MDSAKVMIVEDNTTVAEDCRDCLESLGYTVTSVLASGEEAVERAATDRPDAVLMDIHLRDEMDGIGAAERIYSGFDIPVVFLSAYSDHDLLDRAKQVGSFGYLVKPFDEGELYAMLEMAISKAAAEKERRRMEVRLRQTQKMEGLQLMAGSIAHTFNNMLHASLCYLELAMNELRPGSEVGRMVENASISARRAAEMSTLMLVYVGQGQGEPQDVNFSDLVEGLSGLLRSATGGGTVLSVDLAHEDETFRADPVQIRQMTLNLFTNAVEAIGDDKGTVTLTTRVARLDHADFDETYLHEDLPAGDYVILEVSDTGCGMDEDTLSKIFDPFFTKRFTGRGLGLAAVVGIVRGHRGAIAVESKPGAGTTVRIMFPVCERLDVPVEETPSVVEGRQNIGTILLADDEEVVRTVGTLMLGRFGYTVLTAKDGDEAVEMFREQADEIDCVLLDLTMPRMDGEDAFSELQRIRPDVKVILCSGYEEHQATRAFAGKGLSGFLQKPYKMTELQEKIEEVLRDEDVG